MHSDKKNITLSFVVNGLLGVYYIDLEDTDLNGFYRTTTIIDAPEGRFTQVSYLNPDLFRQCVENMISDIFSQSCHKEYIKRLIYDRQTI